MITFPKILLFVGLMCLTLAAWSLVQGEAEDALLGLGLGAFLLLCWRWALAQSRSPKVNGNI